MTPLNEFDPFNLGYLGYLPELDISVLIGKTLKRVLKVSDGELFFETTEGQKYLLHHTQECCEDVFIESIVGDLNDLMLEPILIATEVSFSGEDLPGKPKYSQESSTWTYYKFATRKGYVDIRFYGSSNGYYSESVSFSEIPNDAA